MKPNDEEAPLVVTGDERTHPAVRLLARACIALARLRLARQGEASSEGGSNEDAEIPVEEASLDG
jgi:hypothetical protein